MWALPAPASAQWVEFVSKEDRFTATFPAQPRVTETTFKSEYGADLPARIYEAVSGPTRAKITVVDYTRIEEILTEKAKNCPPGSETCRGGGSSTGAGYWRPDLMGSVIYATWQFMQRDTKVTYLGWTNMNLVEGHMMYMTNADGTRTSAGIYQHEYRLYILEATVPGNYPDPGFFQQSIGWLDENGENIRYQRMYHILYPPAEDRGRLGGAGPQGGRGGGGGGRGGRGGGAGAGQGQPTP
jgi:hypothetical protein